MYRCPTKKEIHFPNFIKSLIAKYIAANTATREQTIVKT